MQSDQGYIKVLPTVLHRLTTLAGTQGPTWNLLLSLQLGFNFVAPMVVEVSTECLQITYDGVLDLAKTAIRTPAIHKVHEPQLSGVGCSGEACKQGYGTAFCPRGFAQCLQHLVSAPWVLEEAWGNEQHPTVTAAQCMAQLGHNGTSRSCVPKLQEAAQAGSASLQVGDQVLGSYQVLLTVTHADIIVLAPTSAAAAVATTAGSILGWWW